MSARTSSSSSGSPSADVLVLLGRGPWLLLRGLELLGRLGPGSSDGGASCSASARSGSAMLDRVERLDRGLAAAGPSSVGSGRARRARLRLDSLVVDRRLGLGRRTRRPASRRLAWARPAGLRRAAARPRSPQGPRRPASASACSPRTAVATGASGAAGARRRRPRARRRCLTAPPPRPRARGSRARRAGSAGRRPRPPGAEARSRWRRAGASARGARESLRRGFPCAIRKKATAPVLAHAVRTAFLHGTAPIRRAADLASRTAAGPRPQGRPAALARRGRRDPVLPRALRLVERRVGRRDQRVARSSAEPGIEAAPTLAVTRTVPAPSSARDVLGTRSGRESAPPARARHRDRSPAGRPRTPRRRTGRARRRPRDSRRRTRPTMRRTSSPCRWP